MIGYSQVLRDADLHSESNQIALLQKPEYVCAIETAVVVLQSVGLITQEAFDVLVTHASHAEDIAIVVVMLCKARRATADNVALLLENARYAKSIKEFLFDIRRYGTFTQPILMILINNAESNAMYLAECAPEMLVSLRYLDSLGIATQCNYDICMAGVIFSRKNRKADFLIRTEISACTEGLVALHNANMKFPSFICTAHSRALFCGKLFLANKIFYAAELATESDATKNTLQMAALIDAAVVLTRLQNIGYSLGYLLIHTPSKAQCKQFLDFLAYMKQLSVANLSYLTKANGDALIAQLPHVDCAAIEGWTVFLKKNAIISADNLHLLISNSKRVPIIMQSFELLNASDRNAANFERLASIANPISDDKFKLLLSLKHIDMINQTTLRAVMGLQDPGSFLNDCENVNELMAEIGGTTPENLVALLEKPGSVKTIAAFLTTMREDGFIARDVCDWSIKNPHILHSKSMQDILAEFASLSGVEKMTF